MIKKLLPVLLALILLSACSTTEKPAEISAGESEITVVTTIEPVYSEPAAESDFQYTISGGKVYIRKYTGAAERVIMPETIEGNPITTVDMMFITDTPVKELTLSSGTEHITGSIKSEKLEILNIPSSVKKSILFSDMQLGLRR